MSYYNHLFQLLSRLYVISLNLTVAPTYILFGRDFNLGIQKNVCYIIFVTLSISKIFLKFHHKLHLIRLLSRQIILILVVAVVLRIIAICKGTCSSLISMDMDIYVNLARRHPSIIYPISVVLEYKFFTLLKIQIPITRNYC